MNIHNFIFNHINTSDTYYYYYNIIYLKNDLFYLNEYFYYSNLNNYDFEFKINFKLFNYYFLMTTYSLYYAVADYVGFHFKYKGKIFHGYGLSEFTRDYFWYIHHQRLFLGKISQSKLLYESILIHELDYLYLKYNWQSFNYIDIYARLLHKYDEPVFGIETYNKNVFDVYYYIKDLKYLQQVKHLQDWIKVNWLISVIYPMLEFPEGITVYWHRNINPDLYYKSVNYIPPINWLGNLYFLHQEHYDTLDFSIHSWLYLYLYNWQDLELRKINIFSTEISITHTLFMEMSDVYKIIIFSIIIFILIYFLIDELKIYWKFLETDREIMKKRIIRILKLYIDFRLIKKYIRILRIYLQIIKKRNIYILKDLINVLYKQYCLYKTFIKSLSWIKFKIIIKDLISNIEKSLYKLYKFSRKRLYKLYKDFKRYIYINYYIPFLKKFRFYKYYIKTYLKILGFTKYLEDRSLITAEVVEIWGSLERMLKHAAIADSWWNAYPGAHVDWYNKDWSLLLIETYSWVILNLSGTLILRAFFFYFFLYYKAIKQYINYNIYILCSFKLIYLNLEELRLNYSYYFLYFYIYLLRLININKYLKIFSIQNYMQLEIVTYTYDAINNSLSVILNIINPFFKKYINYLHPDGSYRRILPLNEKLRNIYKLIYPIINNYKSNNIEFTNIKFNIIWRIILIWIYKFFSFIVLKRIIKNIYISIMKNIYILKIIYIIKNKKNKDLFFLFFIILWCFNQINIYIISIIILMFISIWKINFNIIFYMIGYIFMFIFDILINIINIFYKIFIYILKYTMIILFIYLLYKFIIVYICNNIFISFILYNIKSDFINIYLHFVEWFINWYEYNQIKSMHELWNMYMKIEEAKEFAWNEIIDPFKNLWRSIKSIYVDFHWEIFSYEAFMNKWLGSYKEEEHKSFRFISMYFIKAAFNSIKDMIKVFILKIIWYLSFYILNGKYLYSKYLINMDMDFYWWNKIIRKLILKYIYIYMHFRYIYIYLIPYNYGEFYSFIFYKIYSIIYVWSMFLSKDYLYLNSINNLNITKIIILLLNYLYNLNFYLMLIYNEYLDKNIITNLEIFKKIREIERLFFYYYLKWFFFKDNIEMLIYNILRFDIEEWKDLDPEALDRLGLKTKRYWLTFGDQNVINRHIEVIEEIYQYGPIKLATEEETEAVLKEMEEERKRRELIEIAERLQMEEKLALEAKNAKLNEMKPKVPIYDPYKGEMVVVPVEAEEEELFDFSDTNNPEILSAYGWTESKIAVAGKKITNYWDFDIELLYNFKDVYDFAEFYDGSYFCLLYKIKYEIETKKKYMSSFSLYFIVEYFLCLYLYIYLYRSRIYLREKTYNMDYKWKDLRKNLDNKYIDNEIMNEKLTYYFRQKRISKLNYVKYLWKNILILNTFNDSIIDFFTKESEFKLKEIYKKFYEDLKLIKSSLREFTRIKFNNNYISKKLKNVDIVRNYIIDENIFYNFKEYFPLKEYLVNKKYIDLNDPKFNDDDLFYYIFISLFKLDEKVSIFLNTFQDLSLNGFITKVNVNLYIGHLHKYLHYFQKIDKYLFFNNGPSFLMHKNKDTSFYEKIGDKVLKHAITYINKETEIEYDYFFIWLYFMPMILILLFYTKHVYFLKNQYFGLTNFIMMEWKINIIISNNIFYTLKVYLDWISWYFTSVEFRSFNKHFYTELDFEHKLRVISKADREIAINSIYDYMYNYKYNYIYASNYIGFPGSHYVILWNNITLMFGSYFLVYLYLKKNVFKYHKNKFYQYIQLYNYYNQLNSLLHKKEIENFRYNEYRTIMIIYLYYTINKSNINLHYLSEMKKIFKNLKKKWL